MVYHRNLILLAVVAFILIFSIASVQAKQPVSPGNPALSACLAQVEQLQQTVAKQQVTIETLQGQINALQASLNTKEQIIADQQATIGKLLDQIAGQKLEIGALEEQIATMQTLLDDMNSYVRLPKTGQTTSASTPGDDGALQKGVPWPIPRFTDNHNGTVTDNLTRLVWLKDANCFGLHEWHVAVPMAYALEAGYCGLLDGSVKGDWRLPNRNELLSLVDIEIEIDAPHIAGIGYFTNLAHVSDNYYWTSSTCQYNYDATAYYLNLYDATSGYGAKASNLYRVWPVRDLK